MSIRVTSHQRQRKEEEKESALNTYVNLYYTVRPEEEQVRARKPQRDTKVILQYILSCGKSKMKRKDRVMMKTEKHWGKRNEKEKQLNQEAEENQAK